LGQSTKEGKEEFIQFQVFIHPLYLNRLFLS